MFSRTVVILGILEALAILIGTLLGILLASPAKADEGCSAGWAAFSTWSNCDYNWNADGSHTHCDRVFVLGFGGVNCFFVPPTPVPL